MIDRLMLKNLSHRYFSHYIIYFIDLYRIIILLTLILLNPLLFLVIYILDKISFPCKENIFNLLNMKL